MADSTRTYRVGKFALDLDRHTLEFGGRPVNLTRKSFDVLRELVLAQGCIVSREDLVRIVWPDSVVEEATIRQTVYTLRSQIRELDAGAEYVETVPKVGYRLIAPVERPEPHQPAAPVAQRPRIALGVIAGGAFVALAAILAFFRWPVGASNGTAHASELVRQGFLVMDERISERYPAAMALFDDALALAPRSADAHAGKALINALNGEESAAFAEAARVQELNATYGVPAAVHGFFQAMYHWRWSEAGHTFSAIDQHGCPDPFCRQWYALYLALTGQSNAAVREAAGAVETFPARLASRALYGQILYWAGDNTAGIREPQTVANAGGAATHARWHLWKAQWLAGDRRAASENLLLALEPSGYRLPPEDEFRQLTAQRELYGTTDFLERLLTIAKHNSVNPYFVAEIALAAGNVSEAADQLDRAVSAHNFFAPYARRDPLFTPLHGTPRYEATMKKIGL